MDSISVSDSYYILLTTYLILSSLGHCLDPWTPTIFHNITKTTRKILSFKQFNMLNVRIKVINKFNIVLWVSLLHFVHTSNLWPNIKICSKLIEIYYTWYFYVLVSTAHNRKRLGGDSPTIKHRSFSYALNIMYALNITKKTVTVRN